LPSYKIIFLGLAVAGPEEELRLLNGLQKKFNLTPQKAEGLLQRVPIVVRKGMSKEEMEKYAKAFQDIGGRVRIEEEPVTEVLEVAPAPEPPRRPSTGRMITCPQCGFEQPEANECMKCGIVISKFLHEQETARSMEARIREVRPETSVEELPPWESGEGFIGAFFTTSREALFSPTKFFKKVAAGQGYGFPLIYAILAGIIGIGVMTLWQWLLLSRFVPVEGIQALPYGISLAFILVMMPIGLILSILIWSALFHFFLIIVGGNKKGFQPTFRAISYTFSVSLFHIIPIIGGLIVFIYGFILTIIGVREGHGISTGRATLAVFLPLILVIIFGIVAAISFPLFLKSFGSIRGVAV
jgi:hypothetical protein